MRSAPSALAALALVLSLSCGAGGAAAGPAGVLSSASPTGSAHPAPPPAADRCLIKPQPPLDIRLEVLDPLKPGAVVRFRVTAVPRVPVEELRFRVLPAAGVEWMGGERSARHAARQDDPDQLVFSVRVPRSGRHALHVEVEMTATDGTVWRRGAGLGLGPNPRADRARVVSDGRGGRALEFEAAPATRVGPTR